MGSLIVDKRTLQVLIRAADQARKDLMEFNRSLQERHQSSPEGFASKVREVRRIHDFLGRAGRSPEDRLSLDFALKERILIGSCLHHLKAQIDIDIRVPGLGKSQHRVLEESRTRINYLIARMHAPGVGLLVKNGELMLNPSLDIDPDQATLDIDLTDEGHPQESSEPTDNFKLFNGSRFAFQEATLPAVDTPSADAASSELALDAGEMKLRLSDPPPGNPVAGSSRSSTKGMADVLEEQGLSSDEDTQGKGSGARHKDLFNPRMLRDAKIRTMARLDLQDFIQAKKKLNLRRMLVHLLGCLEALLLDHALQDLDLYGLDQDKVAEWDFHALALRVFSGKFEAEDLRVLDSLFKARDYLSAAQMYRAPRVLTRAMVQAAESLTRWMISELGYDQVQHVEASTKPANPKLWRSSRS